MTDRQAFLAARCGKLGASDLGTLLGHGHGTNPVNRLWRQKRQEFLTGVAVETEETWPQALGNATEQKILDWTEKKLGVVIARNIPPLFPKAKPWAIINLDGVVYQGGNVAIPVDAKKPGSWKRDEWDGGVPEGYRVQMQQQMWALREEGYTVPYSYLSPAIGDDEPTPVRVDFDEALLAKAHEAADSFMLSIELGEELFDAPTQTEKTVREEAVAVDGVLAEKVALWLRLREEIGPKSKQVEALAKEITDLSPKGARKLALDGVEVLRFDQRSNPRTDWDRLRAENPGLIERYALSPTVSTFPVVVRRKNP